MSDVSPRITSIRMWARSVGGRSRGDIDAVIDVSNVQDLAVRLHESDAAPPKLRKLIALAVMVRFQSPRRATLMPRDRPLPIAASAMQFEGMPEDTRLVPRLGAHVYDDPDDGFRYVISGLWVPCLVAPVQKVPLFARLSLGANDVIETGGVDMAFTGRVLSLSNEHGSIDVDNSSGVFWRPKSASGNN